MQLDMNKTCIYDHVRNIFLIKFFGSVPIDSRLECKARSFTKAAIRLQEILYIKSEQLVSNFSN